MNLPNIFNKIDKSILKKYPFQWIIGWHVFLPIIAILYLFAVVSGYLLPTRVYHYSNKLDFLGLFFGFISFMTFILYVIRQVKFNSFRIHHHIPFKKYILTFFSFWLIFFMLTIIPTIPYFVNLWHTKSDLSKITNNVKKDCKMLYKGSVFFLSDYKNEDNILFKTNEKNIKDNYLFKRTKKDKKIKKIIKDTIQNSDSVTIYNASNEYGYNDYRYEYFFPKTISKKEALTYIANFIEVAKKYNIKLIETNPEKVYSKRKKYIYNYTTPFSLYASNTIGEKSSVNIANDYSLMINNYRIKYNNKFRLMTFILFLMISITITLFLIIFISVPLKDFGLSIFVVVLISIIIGIITSIFSIFNITDANLRLVFFTLLFIFYLITFIGDSNNKLKRILKITSNFLIPIILFLLIEEIDDNIFFNLKNETLYDNLIYIFGIIISVFIYKKIYENYRLLPN